MFQRANRGNYEKGDFKREAEIPYIREGWKGRRGDFRGETGEF